MSSRNAQGGALRVNTKNGCEADNILTSKIGVGRIKETFCEAYIRSFQDT